jgi:hypothetical protein
MRDQAGQISPSRPLERRVIVYRQGHAQSEDSSEYAQPEVRPQKAAARFLGCIMGLLYVGIMPWPIGKHRFGRSWKLLTALVLGRHRTNNRSVHRKGQFSHVAPKPAEFRGDRHSGRSWRNKKTSRDLGVHRYTHRVSRTSSVG